MIPINTFFKAAKARDKRLNKARFADCLGLSRSALNYYIKKDDETFYIARQGRELCIVRHETKHIGKMKEFTGDEQAIINAVAKR